MRAKFDCERMGVDVISVVVSGAVVVETVEEVIEIDCFYFLFLFLGVGHH